MAKKRTAAKPRRHHQIAVYAPGPLLNLLYNDAAKRRLKLGPTCLAILWEYFDNKREREAQASA